MGLSACRAAGGVHVLYGVRRDQSHRGAAGRPGSQVRVSDECHFSRATRSQISTGSCGCWAPVSTKSRKCVIFPLYPKACAHVAAAVDAAKTGQARVGNWKRETRVETNATSAILTVLASRCGLACIKNTTTQNQPPSWNWPSQVMAVQDHKSKVCQFVGQGGQNNPRGPKSTSCGTGGAPKCHVPIDPQRC